MFIPVPIRYSDFDALNHINHLSYLTYLEEARRRFYKEAFSITKPDEYMFILLNVNCDYLKEIKTFIDLIVYLRVKDVYEKRFILEYEIKDKDKFVYLRGTTSHGYFINNSIVSLPTNIMNELNNHRDF